LSRDDYRKAKAILKVHEALASPVPSEADCANF